MSVCEGRKLEVKGEDMYVISRRRHMILTISLISIGYVKIVFDEQSNAFVNTARVTLKFTVIR